jgi:hypothetical protein
MRLYKADLHDAGFNAVRPASGEIVQLPDFKCGAFVVRIDDSE